MYVYKVTTEGYGSPSCRVVASSVPDAINAALKFFNDTRGEFFDSDNITAVERGDSIQAVAA